MKQLAVGRSADGRLEVFALGGRNSVYHVWQLAPNGAWGAWSSPAGHYLRQIALGTGADGRLVVFGLGGDGAVYQHLDKPAPTTIGPRGLRSLGTT